VKTALLSIDFSLCFEERAKKIEELIKLSVAHDTKLLLLPELSYCGYSTDIDKIAKYSFDEGVRLFCALAKKYEINIGFGVAKPHNGRYKNSYLIASKSGEVIALYDKIHIFSFGGEERIFDGGDKLASFEIDGVRFGLCICYDLRFPEIFSIYSKTCDAVLCPSAWAKKRAADFRLLLRARALENRLSMVGVNWRGEEYEKLSLVAKNDGSIEEPLFTSEELDIFEINKKEVLDREPNSVMDKRFGLYVGLYEKLR